MHSRAVRLSVLALLLASGAVAAVQMRNADTGLQALEDRRQALDGVVDRLLPAVADVAAAQKAYVDYGLHDEATFTRVGGLVEQLTTDAARLRSSDYSGQGTAHLEEVWAALSAVTAADAQARARVTADEPLAAADLLLGSTRPHVTALATELRAFREAEQQWLRNQRTLLADRSRLMLGGAAVLWIAGLILLARGPRVVHQRGIRDEAPPATTSPAATAPPHADLEAAADLCGAIARMTETTSLPGILERAARLLDARGLIIWMGAGEELFAAAAFGYDAAVIERLRPIRRNADNATAVAWRTGELRTVAGDESRLGAIVAPMIGPADRIGVLAAEVRNGRETDAATRAVAAILAAQLSAVLSAWPPVSAADAAAPSTAPHPQKPGGSDRQAAAS
jgi:hypothetical protein